MMSPVFPLLGLGALFLFFGRRKSGSSPASLPALKDGGRAVELAPGAPVVTPSGAVQETGEVVAIEPPIITGPLSEGPAVLPVATTQAEVQAAVEALDAVQSRQWQEAVTKAILSQDAQTVETVAKAMSADGLTPESRTVAQVAEQWREDAAAMTSEAREETITPADIEAAEPAPPAPPVNPARDAAAALAALIGRATKGREDRAQVADYQAELGVNDDGLYGPQTAMAIADFGIIPPAPFYWPNDWQTSQSNYRRFLYEKALTDPPRAAQWEAAAESAVR